MTISSERFENQSFAGALHEAIIRERASAGHGIERC